MHPRGPPSVQPLAQEFEDAGDAFPTESLPVPTAISGMPGVHGLPP